jgi:hypothetical protein
MIVGRTGDANFNDVLLLLTSEAREAVALGAFNLVRGD